MLEQPGLHAIVLAVKVGHWRRLELLVVRLQQGVQLIDAFLGTGKVRNGHFVGWMEAWVGPVAGKGTGALRKMLKPLCNCAVQRGE